MIAPTASKLAGDLITGDVIFYADYPVEVESVRLCPGRCHVLLTWGYEPGDWVVVAVGAKVTVGIVKQMAPVWVPGRSV